MKLIPNFYRDRVCLNVLAGSKENAREIYVAAEGHVLVGVLSKNYPDVASAVTDMREYAALILFKSIILSCCGRNSSIGRRWAERLSRGPSRGIRD